MEKLKQEKGLGVLGWTELAVLSRVMRESLLIRRRVCRAVGGRGGQLCACVRHVRLGGRRGRCEGPAEGRHLSGVWRSSGRNRW